MSSQSDLLRPVIRPLVELKDLVAACDLTLYTGTSASGPSKPGLEGRTISGITVSTQDVSEGDLFVALSGLRTHGAQFAAQAIEQGARAVLTDHAGARILRELDVLEDVIILLGPAEQDLRATMARCASAIYADASKDIAISGITGTNGKTTTAFFLDAIMRAAGEKTALLGTVEMRLGEKFVASTRTTVEAPVLQGFFARCVQEDVSHVTMEVSSHALALHRVTGTHFDVVGFTNLQRDHLDFHHTMEEYFEAKAQLFTPQYAQRGVVVVDDTWGRTLADNAAIPVTTVSTGLSDDPEFHADWRASNVRLSESGTGLDFDLVHSDGHTIASHSPLLGSVNVSNAALATLMAVEQNITVSDIVRGLRDLAVVPGRMEVVSEPGDPLVIVDYAHTTEALDFAVSSLRQTHHSNGVGRLIVVFGAAGERDATKRPHMGAAVFPYADVMIVTDDDPYSEDPVSIRNEVLAGVEILDEYVALAPQVRAEQVLNIAPREDAITHAIQLAGPQDTVLLAGRGHETIQEIAGVKHHLDDRAFARNLLQARRLGS